MNHFIWATIVATWTVAFFAAGADKSEVLWYRSPAHTWMTEALPIGNGTLGAMIFGGTDQERLQFNVDSLWTGDDHDTGAYQAFGDVLIDLGQTNIIDYRRQLDIAGALHLVTYQSNGIRYWRSAFASYPAKVIVWRMTADKPGSCTGRVRLTDMHKADVISDGAGRLRATGKLENGLEYESQLLVIGDGGKISSSPGGIAFDGCNGVMIILAADTNYVPDYSRNWRGESPHAAVSKRIDDAAAEDFDRLLEQHERDYQSLYNRFHLDLGKTADDIAALPTNERLARYADQHSADPELEELFCQYGRYLLISSSRKGGLPANLQGLWNESNTPPWRCDYHSNINVEMNYWPSEPTNLAECAVPFIDYVTSLRQVRAIRTKENYGPSIRGWTVRTENNIFGGASYVWNAPGSAWYSQQLWEHFAFGRDTKYLAQAAYPVLKEVCEFWDDHLKRRDDGTLVVPDGWSPEHGPHEDGVSYDQEIVFDLFTNYVEAADALGIDKDYRDRIAGMREKLLKLKIGRWGQLQEWEQDIDDPADQHRHVSHLFALFPGREISPVTTPALTAAAKVSLAARGDGGTGWSRAWKISYWARLLDGDHAYMLLRNLMTVVGTDQAHTSEGGGGVYSNLFDACPPFQIDGNFGATAGIAEMLLQSQVGELHLLPALPSAWPTGSVTGIRGRGGFDLDISWKDGKLQQAVIRSTSGGLCVVRYGQQTVKLDGKAGQTWTLDGASAQIHQ